MRSKIWVPVTLTVLLGLGGLAPRTEAASPLPGMAPTIIATSSPSARPLNAAPMQAPANVGAPHPITAEQVRQLGGTQFIPIDDKRYKYTGVCINPTPSEERRGTDTENLRTYRAWGTAADMWSMR